MCSVLVPLSVTTLIATVWKKVDVLAPYTIDEIGIDTEARTGKRRIGGRIILDA